MKNVNLKAAFMFITVFYTTLSNAQNQALTFSKKEATKLGVVAVIPSHVYMKVAEVSNIEYKQYMHDLKVNRHDSLYKKAILDSLKWLNPVLYYEPMRQYYNSHPAYNDYPVLTISQQQARAYCRWKEQQLNAFLARNNSKIAEVIVRLPTQKEWEDAARIGLDPSSIFPWEGYDIRREDKKSKGQLRLNGRRFINHIPFQDPNLLNDAGFLTTPVLSYWPSKAGLYNMSGNVAEWVQESGVSKGGSFFHSFADCRIDAPSNTKSDSSAQFFVGFRYVIEIVKLKPSKDIQLYKPTKKTITKSFVKISEKDSINNAVYASKTELSNGSYLYFLNAIGSQSKEANDYRIQSQVWEKHSPFPYMQYYGESDIFWDYPVVNISYASALAYCSWLTSEYEKLPNRPFKRVIFRLPTEAEWELAAVGTNKHFVYPWGGPYVQNSKGNYLANYAPFLEAFLIHETDPEMMKPGYNYLFYRNDSIQKEAYYLNFYPYSESINIGIDGAQYTNKCTSYYPNKFGLYNMSGNVSEMLLEKGKSKGGSWDSHMFDIEVKSQQQYETANPTTGFRVFMEVLEQ
jgi:sulfatase modifying factor 1